MAKFVARPTVTMNITLALTEDEARAIEALGRYGDDAFVKAFYASLGEHYMKPHEAGLRSFLRSTREMLKPVLERLDRLQNDLRA
jgi:hypothetical protein